MSFVDQRPITVSSNNSTTATLTAGATFTGTYESILSYQQVGINVAVRPNVLIAGDASDAKGSLFLDFSSTGSGTPVAPPPIPYVVRSPGLFIPQVPITVTEFFRVRYINDGGVAAIAALGLVETAGTATAQTSFELKTLLYPQATKELLRTLDQAINDSDPASLQIAVLLGKNPAGRNVKVRTSADGELLVSTGSKTIVNSDHFGNGIDSGEWTTTTSGTGAISATAGVGRFVTGTTANSSVTLIATQTWPYRPGSLTVFDTDVRMGDTGTTNNTRQWGMFTANDGYFFELSGTTFSAVNRSSVSGAPVDTKTTITAFTKDTSFHDYQIRFQKDYVAFIIDGVEYVALSNSSSTARTATLDLPISFGNVNSGGGTTNVTMDVREVSQSTIGQTDPEAGHPTYYAGASGTVAVSSTQRVVNIQAMSESNSGTVRIDIGGVTGSSIPIRNAWGASYNTYGQIIGPTIVFTSTVSYAVWVVND